MLIYCHAVGSFHYEMEKERWMFLVFFLHLFVTFEGPSFKQYQVAGSQNVKQKIFMIS